MKKLIFILFTASLLSMSCTEDDNPNKTDDKDLADEANLILGRWKFIGTTDETLQDCDKTNYISFDKNGKFVIRSSDSYGISTSNTDGTITNEVLSCSPETYTGNYVYTIKNNEIVFSSESNTTTAKNTLENDQLKLSYDNGSYTLIYKRESKDNLIVEPNPLVSKWNFFSSSKNNNPFIEVKEGDCYKSAYIIFGINGNYLSHFPKDNNKQCIIDDTYRTYTNDESSITIISDTAGTENTVTKYTIEGDFLTIDQSGDQTYIERFKRYREQDR